MNFNETNDNACNFRNRVSLYTCEQFSPKVATLVIERVSLGFIFKARMFGMFGHYLKKKTSK